MGALHRERVLREVDELVKLDLLVFHLARSSVPVVLYRIFDLVQAGFELIGFPDDVPVHLGSVLDVPGSPNAREGLDAGECEFFVRFRSIDVDLFVEEIQPDELGPLLVRDLVLDVHIDAEQISAALEGEGRVLFLIGESALGAEFRYGEIVHVLERRSGDPGVVKIDLLERAFIERALLYLRDIVDDKCGFLRGGSEVFESPFFDIAVAVDGDFVYVAALQGGIDLDYADGFSGIDGDLLGDHVCFCIILESDHP